MLDAEISGLDALMAPVRGATPPVVAVVQPVTRDAMTGVLDAVGAKLVRAILVGQRERIVAELHALGREEHEFEIAAAADDRAAAESGIALVRTGRAEMLMKGHIHSDDFLKPAVDRTQGLRTAQRMSHAFVCYFPAAVRHKALLVTDAALNIAPDLACKADILKHAVELMHALGVVKPKVAILAAIETVNPAMPATVDAAALQKMAGQGLFGESIVEGPLAFDDAISHEAAQIKGIVSEVAGDPDIVLVPDIEAGNVLYKAMVHLCHAIAPGVVLGARVPLILTSRADPPLARTASCALAAKLVLHRRARSTTSARG